MAYLFMPFPMTLDDLEGHLPNAGLIECNSTKICAICSTVLTVTAHHVVPRPCCYLCFVYIVAGNYIVLIFSMV